MPGVVLFGDRFLSAASYPPSFHPPILETCESAEESSNPVPGGAVSSLVPASATASKVAVLQGISATAAGWELRIVSSKQLVASRG
jgi:hypothetical protein